MEFQAINVIYASQTGTVEKFSHRLKLQLQLFYPHLEVNLWSADEFRPVSKLRQLSHGLLVLVSSTTGDGHAPDQLAAFWAGIMHKNLPAAKSLLGLNHICLGFGDSNYRSYNEVGVKLYRRLQYLGSKPVRLADEKDSGLFLMDDSAPGGIMSGISHFLESFFAYLNRVTCSQAPVNWSSIESPENIAKLKPWPNVQILSEEHQQPMTDQDEHIPWPEFVSFACTDNVRVTSTEHFQDTRLITLKKASTGEDCDYVQKPGDVLYVQPRNSHEDVRKLLELTGVRDTVQFRVTSNDQVLNANKVYSASSLLLDYFDLNATPNQFFFLDLASLHPGTTVTEDLAREQERLLEFGQAMTNEDVNDFYAYATRPKRTVLEVLLDFPATCALLRPQKWFSVLPGPMRPRPYSLASAPQEDLQLLVAIVHYKTLMSKPRRGVCSSFIRGITPGSCIFGRLARPPGVLDFDETNPAIMIAPGTCIAPMRSFLRWQARKTDPGSKNLLVFGCRTRTDDCYFCEEFSQDESTETWHAFSREPNQPKVYVQALLERRFAEVRLRLERDRARVYIVANNSSMARETREVFERLMTSELSLAQLESEHRFQIEAWG